MISSESTLQNCVIRTFDGQFDLAALAYHHPQRYPYLLQSVAHGTAIARFDILFAFPGESIALNQLNKESDFLSQLDQQYAKEQCERDAKLDSLPFHGGWFLYLGYELAQQVEPILQLPDASDTLPVAFACRCPAAVIWDHQLQELILVAEADQVALLDTMQADLEALTTPPEIPLTISGLSEDPAHQFTDGVAKIKHYIVEGDIFQVNLSRAWYADVASEDDLPMGLYQRLCQSNPAPFAALVP